MPKAPDASTQIDAEWFAEMKTKHAELMKQSPLVRGLMEELRELIGVELNDIIRARWRRILDSLSNA